MNGSYYGNPIFNPKMEANPSEGYAGSELETEQSYIENILRMNKGKYATAYVSFSDSVEWRDKSFSGIIEASGRDHLIMSDPNTGKWYLILLIYLDYVEFDEKITYKI